MKRIALCLSSITFHFFLFTFRLPALRSLSTFEASRPLKPWRKRLAKEVSVVGLVLRSFSAGGPALRSLSTFEALAKEVGVGGLLFTFYFLLPPPTFAYDTPTPHSLPSTTPFGISLVPNLQRTPTPTSAQIIESLRTTNHLASNSGQLTPVTIPITTSTTLNHLQSISNALTPATHQTPTILPIIHLTDAALATPSGSLTTLVNHLNSPNLTWPVKPIIIFGTQPHFESSDLSPEPTDLNQITDPYSVKFLGFASTLDPSRYTLIPALILLRSSNPTPQDWTRLTEPLYQSSPHLALYAHHFNPQTDTSAINQLRQKFPEANLFFASLNLTASSPYQNQLELLNQFDLPEHITLSNIAIPNHCSTSPLYLYLNRQIYTQSGATAPQECLQTISVVRITDAGVSSLSRFISALFTTAILVAVIFVFAQIIIAGYAWISAGGDKSKVEAARSRISNALIGLTIVAASWALIKVIGLFFGVDITNMVLPSAAPTLL